MLLRVAVTIATFAITSSALEAQPYRSVYDPPPSPPPSMTPVEVDDGAYLYVAGHAGLNLPIGALGAELGVGLDWFRGAVSIGRGFRGTSVAGMVRAVKDVDGIDFAVGLGLSRGPGLNEVNISFGDRDPEDDHLLVHYASDTKWIDLEVSAELMLSRSGFVRFTLGMTHAIDIACIAVDDKSGAEMGCGPVQDQQLHDNGFTPYFGLAFGVRFPPPPSRKPRFQAAPALWTPAL